MLSQSATMSRLFIRFEAYEELKRTASTLKSAPVRSKCFPYKYILIRSLILTKIAYFFRNKEIIYKIVISCCLHICYKTITRPTVSSTTSYLFLNRYIQSQTHYFSFITKSIISFTCFSFFPQSFFTPLTCFHSPSLI